MSGVRFESHSTGREENSEMGAEGRGQFLGFSRNHSSTIGLLRNLQTGSISPQFHVVFDELWVELFVSEREYYGPDEEEEEDANTIAFLNVDPEWLPIAEQPLPPLTQPVVLDDSFDAGADFDKAPAFEVSPDPLERPDPIDAVDGESFITENKRTRRPNKRVLGDEWVNHTVQLTP